MDTTRNDRLTPLILFAFAACLYLASLFTMGQSSVAVYTVRNILSIVPYVLLVIHGILNYKGKTKAFFNVYFILASVKTVFSILTFFYSIYRISFLASFSNAIPQYLTQGAFNTLRLVCYIIILVQHHKNSTRRILSRISLIILVVVNMFYGYVLTYVYAISNNSSYLAEVFTSEFLFNSLLSSILPDLAYIVAMVGCLIYIANEARANQTLQKES